MKRKAVLKKIKDEAKRRGFSYQTVQLSRHEAVIVNGVSRTLKRHNEIDDVTARAVLDQFAEVFGKGWWR